MVKNRLILTIKALKSAPQPPLNQPKIASLYTDTEGAALQPLKIAGFFLQ